MLGLGLVLGFVSSVIAILDFTRSEFQRLHCLRGPIFQIPPMFQISTRSRNMRLMIQFEEDMVR